MYLIVSVNYINIFDIFRSTVEFARDVSNYKASEDVLKGIETMSGVTKQDDIINARVGSNNNRGYMKPTTQKNVNITTSYMYAIIIFITTSYAGYQYIHVHVYQSALCIIVWSSIFTFTVTWLFIVVTYDTIII